MAMMLGMEATFILEAQMGLVAAMILTCLLPLLNKPFSCMILPFKCQPKGLCNLHDATMVNLKALGQH